MKHIKKSIAYKIFEIFNMSLMVLICILCIAPVLHVVFASLSDPINLAGHSGIVLRPLGFTLRGFEIIFARETVIRGYLNTIFYVVTGVSISLTLTTLGGYALSRKNVLWSNAIMFFITFTMLFSGGLIPFFIVVQELGMINTRWAVILPTAISVFNLIIMRTSLLQIPDSLEESAKLDGAGHFTIMLKIILPLAKATISVILLFYAVSMWNSWFIAALFITDRALFPLQLVLREVLIAGDAAMIISSSADAIDAINLYRPLIKYAVIVVSVLPVLSFYPFIQKYFVTGVMIGSIKG